MSISAKAAAQMLGGTQKLNFEVFKDMFNYFWDTDVAMKAWFECMLWDISRIKDSSTYNEYFANSNLAFEDIMTIGSIYKMYELDINIQDDIKKISKLFEDK